MKIFLFLLFLGLPVAYAQQDALNYMDDEQHPGEPPCAIIVDEPYPSFSPCEDDDPFEGVNRSIFMFNEFLNMVLFDPLSRMYNDLVPEFLRERVGYALRNLGEPVVLANNILQGEFEEGRTTIWRFVINSTVGGAGLFDVSTDLGFPYKKQDFGLTLASWGVESGPYIVLPILGPCTIRDTFGRAGDYVFDPINWWTYRERKEGYSYLKTGVQMLDARASYLELLEGLKKNSLDYYATLRTWYQERRRDLSLKQCERTAIDTPRPDDEDEW